MTGKFITFEGIDGTGKSTQAKKLCSILTKKGIDCISTFEPGAHSLGKQIRQMLMSGSLNHIAECYLFAADRAMHVREVIKPALAKGTWLVCDRYLLSSIAYQGYGRNLDPEWVREINEKAVDDVLPDLTILLDAPVKTGLSRAKRDNHFENFDLLERVRQGFLLEAKKESDIIKIVDATKTVGLVTHDVEAIIQKILEV